MKHMHSVEMQARQERTPPVGEGQLIFKTTTCKQAEAVSILYMYMCVCMTCVFACDSRWQQVSVSYPFPSKPSNHYTPLNSTCQHHRFTTPPGVSWAGSWTIPSSWPPVATAYRAVCLACPYGHFTAKVRSSHSPRTVRHGPGQPTHLTVCRPRK